MAKATYKGRIVDTFGTEQKFGRFYTTIQHSDGRVEEVPDIELKRLTLNEEAAEDVRELYEGEEFDDFPFLIFTDKATCPVCSANAWASEFVDDEGWRYCSASCATASGRFDEREILGRLMEMVKRAKSG